MKAYNTDIVGFRSSLLELLGDERPQALLFGTGGVAVAVGYVLRELGISFRQVSRSPERAELTYTALEEALHPEELLWINATSVGLQAGECLPLPYDRLSPGVALRCPHFRALALRPHLQSIADHLPRASHLPRSSHNEWSADALPPG